MLKPKGTIPVSFKTAASFCTEAAGIVSGARKEVHGDMAQLHELIAGLWSAYKNVSFSPRDVALMMVLLKTARTKTGDHNRDDYVDICGYGAIAGELAERETP